MQFLASNKKKIIICVLELFLLGNAFFALKLKDGEIPYIVYVATFIVFLTMIALPDYERISGKNRKQYLITIVLSMIFIAMFSIGELITGVQNVKYNAVFVVAFVLSSFYLVAYVYFRLHDFLSEDEVKYSSFLLDKTFWVCFILICISSILMMLSTDIGVYASGDVYEVFDMARGIDPWSEWHTIGYGLWCKLLITLFGESLGSIIKINCILWIAVNFFVLLYLKNVKKSEKAIKIYTFLGILVFSPYYYNLVGYKDNVFSMAFLGVILYILYLITEEDNKVYVIFLGCFSMALASSTRHGGMVPVLVGTIGAVIYSLVKKDKRKLVFAIVPAVFAIIVNMGINFTGTHILHAEKNPDYIAFTTPLYMVSAMANDGVDFSEEDECILEQIATMDEWASYYNKYWLDDVARDYGKIGPEKIEKISYLMENNGFKGDLIRVNWHLVTHYPVKYVRSLLDASSLVWEISRPIDGYEWPLPYDKRDNIKYRASFLVTSNICELTQEIPIYNSISWRGGIALFVMILLSALVIEKKKWKFFAVLAPILVWEMMFMISCYAQDSRYILPAIEIATLLLVAIPLECRGENV